MQGYRSGQRARLAAEVIPTLRRNRDDAFLIGEESILADQGPGRDPDPTIAIEDVGGAPSRRPARSSRLLGSLQGARGIALLGLGAGAAAVIAALELGGGTAGPTSRPTTSSRSPLISRSAAGLPAGPPVRAHARAPRPAVVHRPIVVKARPRRPQRPARSRPTTTVVEPEREPTLTAAPVSSPAVVTTEPSSPTPAGVSASVHATPPSPPPPSSGGGSAGVENFGFER